LTRKQTPAGTLNYTCDAAGDVLTIASSNTNGASLTYTYDTLNRLATVTDNRLVAQGAASGTTTYKYDSVGNLGASKNATALSNYAYSLGAAGNRTTVAELSGRTVNYGYDALYRLTSETVASDPIELGSYFVVLTGLCHKRAPHSSLCHVNAAFLNTFPECFRAGLVVGKSLMSHGVEKESCPKSY
jgi:YD repeat-containing protein